MEGRQTLTFYFYLLLVKHAIADLWLQSRLDHKKHYGEKNQLLKPKLWLHSLDHAVLTCVVTFIFAGLYFKGQDAKKWLQMGGEILEEEVEEKMTLTDALESSKRSFLEDIKSGFKVIYLHNGYLNKDVIKELEKLNCQVICRLNYGHDIGACKDINLLINSLGISMKIEWLLWCNDSNYF